MLKCSSTGIGCAIIPYVFQSLATWVMQFSCFMWKNVFSKQNFSILIRALKRMCGYHQPKKEKKKKKEGERYYLKWMKWSSTWNEVQHFLALEAHYFSFCAGGYIDRGASSAPSMKYGDKLTPYYSNAVTCLDSHDKHNKWKDWGAEQSATSINFT